MPPISPKTVVDAGPAAEVLSTAVAWADAEGNLLGVNPAFARWMGVSARRLQGQSLAALEMDGDAMARFLRKQSLQDSDSDVLRLQRMTLGLPGESQHFAEGWLSRLEDGGWLLEAHPLDEFPALDPAQALPSALGAALKGLAHELRNPLAGLKGAAQLLARRALHRDDNEDERELIGLMESEIERLNELRVSLDEHRQGGLTEKNRALIRHVLVEEVWGSVLGVPEALMRLAIRQRDHAPLRAGVLAGLAVAIQILSLDLPCAHCTL